MARQPFVVHKDAHLLVVFKPSGMATTAPEDGDCLVRWAQDIDAGAPALHPVSRLDAEVSGLVTFARTRQGNQALLAARTSGAYRRFYLALAARAPQPLAGSWRAPIAIDPRDPRRRIAMEDSAAQRKKAREAVTEYETAKVLPRTALLYLQPRTGRTHQLRVHTASAGSPLLGDKHYGGPVRVVMPDGRVVRVRRTMLHCARLVLPDPVNAAEIDLSIEPPRDMSEVWTALGGGDDIPLPPPTP